MRNLENIYIYKITNKINNKGYIGITSNPEERWNYHCTRKRESAISQAIAKHGKNNFTFEVIEESQDWKSAFSLEKEYIKKYKTHVSEGKGYNVAVGGQGNLLTSEQWEKALKGKSAEMRAVNVYSKDGMFIERYKSQRECSRELDISLSSVRQCVSGRSKQTHGYCMFFDGVDIPSSFFESNNFGYNRVKVSIVGKCIKTDRVTEFNSIVEAAKFHKIDASHIGRCCKGKQKTSKGYKWMYKEDYEKMKEAASLLTVSI